MAKNIICLIDGTRVSASQAGHYDSYSNVFELACLLQLSEADEEGAPQVVFYTSGISSQPDNYNIFNLATGNSIKSQIFDQYTNICANFDFSSITKGTPDKLFLFGFSRGAMAIRALAGIIAEYGLLHPRDIRHLPLLLDAWQRRRGRNRVRQTVNFIPIEVEFIGIFDSVMGGIDWMSIFNPIKFRSGKLPARCKHGVQILAMDENRSMFRPRLWEGANRFLDPVSRQGSRPYLKQIWMPGVHSDIGGTADEVCGQAALLAMTYYIKKLTKLQLDRRWLSEKEQILRQSIFDDDLHVFQHRGPLSNYMRKASHLTDRFERLHPIINHVENIYLGSSKSHDWKDKVLQSRFSHLEHDKELGEYFSDILLIAPD